MEIHKLAELVKERKEKLIKVTTDLKSQFVGLDDVIDSLYHHTIAWYCLPELLTRPTIVNLWGMTGVGKTDLIRQFTEQIGMSRQFVEIQMSTKSDTSRTTVRSVLEESDLLPSDHGILLLDEIQRFRTIDSHGEEVSDCDFQDVWMLLSDGRFSGSFGLGQELYDMLATILFQQDYNDVTETAKDKKSREKKSSKRKYKTYIWTARRLKRLLHLDEDLETIMSWDDEKIQETINVSLSNQSAFVELPYSKLLVIVSGNLDEAYSMARYADDADIDADILHEFSRRITVVDIKASLLKRFRPEQISRFGNNHIIYPAFSRKNFQDIISKYTGELVDSHDISDIDIQICQSVRDFIYRNGVFPAQGVRPVISTISSVLGSSLPDFLLYAIEHGENKIKVRCSGNTLVADIGAGAIDRKVEGNIDEIKKKTNVNQKVKTSVHEAGHAVAYAILFGAAPTQIISNTSSSESKGYIGCHNVCNSKEFCRNLICTMLAGQSAEETVFGEDKKTNGCSADIAAATKIATKYFREWGMDGSSGLYRNPFSDVQHTITGLISSDESVEQMIKQEKSRASQILTDNKPLFVDVSALLIQEGEMSPGDFVTTAAKNGLIIKSLPLGDEIIDNYQARFEQFKS